MLRILIPLILVVGVSLFLKEFFSSRRSSLKTPALNDWKSYRISRHELFSRSECSVLREIDKAVGSEFRIFAKVRLADLLRVEADTAGADGQSVNRWISGKKVDFVICTPSDLSVRAVIELDDGIQLKAGRSRPEDVTGHVLNAAGIPLLRLRAKSKHSAAALKRRILSVARPSEPDPLMSGPAGSSLPADGGNLPGMLRVGPTPAGRPVACPACGSQLIRRRVKSGRFAGRAILACTAFPECRQVLPLPSDRSTTVAFF